MSVLNVPEDLRYASTHEWLRLDGDVATVGITDHAQQELSDVVYLDLPKVGAKATAKGTLAVVESVKAASDIYAPVAGEVIEVNSAVVATPALVNTDPYGQGWLFKLKVNPSDAATLLDAAAYRKEIGG